jgi:hypothetical protein
MVPHAGKVAGEVMETPVFGQVTGLEPRAALRGRALVRVFLFDTFVAAGVAILFGLRFPILDAISSPSSGGNSGPNGGGVLFVLATVWLTRAVMLWPLWRARESKAPAAIAAVPRNAKSEV